MVAHHMETSFTNDGVPSTAPGRIPTEQVSPVSPLSNSLYGEMSPVELAVYYMEELNTYLRKEPYTDRYGVELIRRAIAQGDQEAWTWVQHCFGGVVLDWLRRHPRAEQAFHFGWEEHYLAQTFECFRQAAAVGQLQAYTSLPTVLRYLQACLNGVLLDALRSKARPKAIPLHEPASVEEQAGGDHQGTHQVWEHI